MAVHEDTKTETPRQEEDRAADAGSEHAELLAPGGEDAGQTPPESEDAETSDVVSPTQLGTKRFVYAAYFGGAIGIAFIVSKVIDFAWIKLQSYRPAVGDPRDEIVMSIAGLIGVSAALYYWNRTRARELAEQVATEMSRVTWPSRTEVTNGTFVVIVTTVVSTVFFALMDKFWGFVTNLVYGGT
jgi:preprotein translocase subunit SecE